MTMSKDHRSLPISDIEAIVTAPILLSQFKLYSKGKQPVAFLSWATVSDEIKARIESGDKKLDLKDWRSGSNLVVVDCVSPFNPREVFADRFVSGFKEMDEKKIGE